ncbi:hypothetical protein VMC_40920 [Vibrio alginolyticus 40B]|nr:hypothetical protein VMC_40920 [Vibrio alginolyticus 40B]
MPKRRRNKRQQLKQALVNLITQKWQNCAKNANVLLANVKRKKNKAKRQTITLMIKNRQLRPPSPELKRKKHNKKIQLNL